MDDLWARGAFDIQLFGLPRRPLRDFISHLYIRAYICSPSIWTQSIRAGWVPPPHSSQPMKTQNAIQSEIALESNFPALQSCNVYQILFVQQIH